MVMVMVAVMVMVEALHAFCPEYSKNQMIPEIKGPPISIPRPNCFTISVTNVFGVVLLNPKRSSNL